MLASAETAEMVSEILDNYGVSKLILDPVFEPLALWLRAPCHFISF